MDKLTANTNALLTQSQRLCARVEHDDYLVDSAWLCLHRAYLGLLAELAAHWRLPASLALEATQLARAAEQQGGHSRPLSRLSAWTEQGEWPALIEANATRLLNPPRAEADSLLRRPDLGAVEQLQPCLDELQVFIESWRRLSAES